MCDMTQIIGAGIGQATTSPQALITQVQFLSVAGRIGGCVLQCVAACCSVLQCVAVCCSVLQCVVNLSQWLDGVKDVCSCVRRRIQERDRARERVCVWINSCVQKRSCFVASVYLCVCVIEGCVCVRVSERKRESARE